MEKIIIIGGGAIGGALAHDLSLRGFSVTLFEKGELLSGTSGRHHGLLHSGGRYVLHDPDTARECWEENQVLKQIVPEGLEQNDGLFVALDDDDLTYFDPFIQTCQSIDIPVTPLSPEDILKFEPQIHPEVKAAVRVPDATMDAWRLPLHFFATARENGASIHTFSEVKQIHCKGKKVTGVTVANYQNHATTFHTADVVVNAAGPWSGKIAAMVDILLPVQPAPGVMVSIPGRLTDMVINRLHPAGDGDIVVPQRGLSILGTSTWLAEDPDNIELPDDHVRRIRATCAEMLPSVAELPIHATWSAARPLIVHDAHEDPTKISRGFDCIDHADTDDLNGFISVIGGKATTMRAMAEHSADLICHKTNRNIPCQTRESRLAPYRRWYRT